MNKLQQFKVLWWWISPGFVTFERICLFLINEVIVVRIRFQDLIILKLFQRHKQHLHLFCLFKDINRQWCCVLWSTLEPTNVGVLFWTIREWDQKRWVVPEVLTRVLTRKATWMMIINVDKQTKDNNVHLFVPKSAEQNMDLHQRETN